ncbi:MAG: YesL family protein [Oscillospiraceae bacterium]|nr:YesL family protein [Oscillospiraceae bacterium]
MKGMFSPDSKFMTTMNSLCDLVILNVIYIITCIPIFTIGAATTALYTVCFGMGTVREGRLVKGYFKAFASNFKQATVLWLAILLLGAASAFNMYFFYSMIGSLRWLFIVFGVAGVLILLVSAYAFPLLSRFDNGNISTVRNALLLSIGYFPRSAAVVIINVFPIALLLTNVVLFLQTGLIWVMIYFAAGAYINTRILKKVFAPYLGDEEEGK